MLLAASIVAVWLATGGGRLVVKNAALFGYGGVTWDALVAHEWWRLIASQFLHVYAFHAALNALGILIVGGMLERKTGGVRFLLVYFLCGTAGQLVAVAIAPRVVASGASQAALGVAAAMLVIELPRRSREAIASLAYIAIGVALDVIVAHALKLPHATSLAAGAACGVLLRSDRFGERVA
jgi:membrane associated rhomboid family serine protease